MDDILNISAYRFVDLDDPHALRDRLLPLARRAGLLGTILLAREGINLFLAGAPESVRGFLDTLRTDARFAGLVARESRSAAAPFRRLRVKVKPEIIRMDRPAVRPGAGRAPALDPATLARWLDRGRDDDGRPVALLDTRNAFEVAHGTFEGAIDWRLDKFSDFPAAAAANGAQLHGHTVVTFCTGGIRCEKAALVLRDLGHERVLQLDGGILGYFAALGGSPHYQGHCFVFDERRPLTAELRPSHG